jgi:hypothetical protein
MTYVAVYLWVVAANTSSDSMIIRLASKQWIVRNWKLSRVIVESTIQIKYQRQA